MKLRHETRSGGNGAWAIETRGLTKIFDSTRAVDGIDLEVKRGSIFGFLGPNGAGKTTMVRMLATLLKPDGGTARVMGFDLVSDAQEVRRRISLTGQFASVDEDLTGLENLTLLGRLLGLRRREARERARELLVAFDLTEASNRQLKHYSGGMRRRIDIAASILVTPELLFLDEPTTGLDPRSRGEVWEIIRGLAAGGTTILLTTQYLEEADQLAERIAVIDHGRVIAEGTPSALKASVGRSVLHLRFDTADQRSTAQSVLQALLDDAIHTDGDPRALSIQLADASVGLRALSALSDAEIDVTEYSLGRPTLDEVFFALTGHPAVDSTTDDQPDPFSEPIAQ